MFVRFCSIKKEGEFCVFDGMETGNYDTTVTIYGV